MFCRPLNRLARSVIFLMAILMSKRYVDSSEAKVVKLEELVLNEEK